MVAVAAAVAQSHVDMKLMYGMMKGRYLINRQRGAILWGRSSGVHISISPKESG